MDDARLFELLVDLHEGLDRQGPGDDAHTRRALGVCELPARPDVLDVGCGTGAATLTLATATGGQVTGVDLMPAFVAVARTRMAAAGVADRVRIVEGDMAALPFPPGAFDLIWSEGAAYNVGLERALALWTPLLRPGGWLALTDLTWLVDEPPAEARAWWQAEYPTMATEAVTRARFEAAGLEVVETFPLPPETWEASYYGPLEARLQPFLDTHPGDAAARAVVADMRAEMDLVRRHHDAMGYVFFVARRPA